MGLPLYLAITAPEISAADVLPKQLAYMACHFSSCNTGLSNFPPHLPEGFMLILNDSIPPGDHDPQLIGRQLAELSKTSSCILLDLQRPDIEMTYQITEAILSCVSCPVIVSDKYAAKFNCPVFVSAPPANRNLKTWLDPWIDREVWIEATFDARTITLDETGSRISFTSPWDPALLPHRDDHLHCHYKIEIQPEQVHFTLQRTADDLKELLGEAERLGVVGAVGLYQELGTSLPCDPCKIQGLD